jgi:hypothetical protein
MGFVTKSYNPHVQPPICKTTCDSVFPVLVSCMDHPFEELDAAVARGGWGIHGGGVF